MKERIAIRILKISLITYIFLFSSNVLSKDLYVSPIGDDNLPYSEVTISEPWKTLIHAIYNLKAGDTLYIRSGTYKPAYPLFLRSTYTSQIQGGHPTEEVNAESGTLDLPVTITGYNGEKVIIDLIDTRIFIHIDNVNYWTIENLNIINSQSAFTVAVQSSADNIVFRNLYIEALYGGDNSANIKINGGRATNITIHNNYLVGPGIDDSIHLNTSTIFANRLDSVTITNNRIENAPLGIYYKHANPLTVSSNILIKNNYILNTSRAALETNSNGALIENNIFGENCSGVSVNQANGVPGGDNNVISHNTFYGCGLALTGATQDADTSLPGAINNKLKNNIFPGPVSLHRYSDLPHNTILNFNLYGSDPAIVQDRIEYNLSAWKTLTGEGNNSLVSTPRFIRPINHNLISSYKLAPNTIGTKAAEDSSDMGADVTTVGPNITSFRAPVKVELFIQ
jgi:pectate lyase